MVVKERPVLAAAVKSKTASLDSAPAVTARAVKHKAFKLPEIAIINYRAN